jgi:hypothetical protein
MAGGYPVGPFVGRFNKLGVFTKGFLHPFSARTAFTKSTKVSWLIAWTPWTLGAGLEIWVIVGSGLGAVMAVEGTFGKITSVYIK